MKKFILIAIGLVFGQILNAQNIEDGLNLSTSNAVLTARAGALGVAYNGIVDDFSAISANPAGLSLIDKGEISFGFGFNYNNTETDFMSSINSQGSTNAYLSNFGLVAPFSIGEKNATFAIGYYLESNFDNAMEFAAKNPHSTYISSEAETAWQSGWGINENFATYLWLADDNYQTPISGGLYQEALINEKGGIKNVSGAFSLELTDFLSAGFSITGKWGSYDYIRDYKETDIDNIYDNLSEEYIDGKLVYHNIDFNQLRVNENINQIISGISGAFGIQGKVANFMRLGFSIKFPTFYDVSEDFTQKATAIFDNGDITDTTFLFYNDYSLVSPWVYSGGASVNLAGVTLSGGFEYTDYSQMEFDNDYNLENLNLQIQRDMTGVLKVGGGVEWQTPFLPLDLRASLSYTDSPFLQSLSGEERLSYGFGAGIYLASNLRLDLLGRYETYKKMWNIYNYGEGTELSFTRNPLDISMQLTYRY